MKVVEIDLTGCKSLRELHARIRVALDFPEWYGANWSAFWDVISRECDADKLIIKGEDTLSSSFDDHLKIMHELLEENKKLWADSDCPFDYEIVS